MINSIFLYGPPGTGKTHMLASAGAWSAIWATPRKSNLAYYNSWVKANPKDAAKDGLKEVPDGRIQVIAPKMFNLATKQIETVSVKEKLDGLICQYASQCMEGTMPATCFVIDDCTMMFAAVYAELHAATSNAFAAQDAFEDWLRGIMTIGDMVGRPMFFTGHGVEPKYHEEGPKKGQLKFTGGPKFPFGRLVQDICAIVDAVLRVEVLDVGMGAKVKSTVQLRTQRTSKYEAKWRVAGTEALIKPDLRPLFRDAGLTLNNS